MKWTALEALWAPRWIRVPEDATLECEIIPGAAIEVAPLMWSPLAETVVRRVCTSAFVNFRGVKGGPENTVEARIKLYNWGPCRQAINAELGKASLEAAEGEAGAASVSPATE